MHPFVEVMQAIWNGVVIADSEDTVLVEGNHYFPAEALNGEFFEPSESKTVCSWKGIASYYDVVVDGERNRDAAWHYPDPLGGAEVVHGRVAFWNGITVVASVTEDSS
jgi:uncharacterized protein (DUF427 family)